MAESRDLDPRRFWWVVAIVLVVVGLVFAAAWWVWQAQQRYSQPVTRFNPYTDQPPPPRLQQHPQQDLAELRRREEALLSTYGWIDRDAGVIRIPIDRAMQVMVEQGLPFRGNDL